MDDQLHTFLANHASVNFIRFQWFDLSGVLRTRIVTKAHCNSLVESSQYMTVAVFIMSFPVSGLQIAKTPATGCAELRPDWMSLRQCYSPTHASVMCHFYVRGMNDPFGLCPRTALERVLNEAEASGKTFKVGYEVEFVILNQDLELLSGSNLVTTNSTTTGLRGNVLKALEEVVTHLEHAGIVVQDFHSEGSSQLELATGPLSPLEAIDALAYTQETIKAVFASHDMHATMAPYAHASASKSGAHTHISLTQPDGEDFFLAGMLDHLHIISAFGLANYDSFVRVGDSMDAMGAWISWGHQHRDVPIRKIKYGHWEIRCVDATANPYLVLALLIFAGMEGIKTENHLEMHGLSDFASKLGPTKLAEIGVNEKLPGSMDQAVELLRNSSYPENAISKALHDTYVNVKEQDLQVMGGKTDEQRRAIFVRMF